ncbi:MAG: hypothetical protein QXO51_07285 [Halobacteria archaeon]
MEDLTPLLYTTKSNLLRQVLDRGGAVLGMRAPGWKGILATDHALTTRLSERIRSTGVEGFISTDELPKYGISIVERDAAEGAFHLGERDTVIMVAGPRSAAERAIRILEDELGSAGGDLGDSREAPVPPRVPDRRASEWGRVEPEAPPEPRRRGWGFREPESEPEEGVTSLRKIDPRKDVDVL